VGLTDKARVVKTASVSAADDEEYTFADLQKYKNGTDIAYTVESDPVDDYTIEYFTASTTSTKIVYEVWYRYTPQKITVRGVKRWDDEGHQTERPASVTIRLKADGREFDPAKTVTIDSADNRQWVFTDLPKYENGREIVYTVTEDGIYNSDYTSAVTGNATDGFTVTNTYDPGKIQLTVSKVWEDKDDWDKLRPDSVTVKLLADGADTGQTRTLDKAHNWQATFEGLDKKKTDGTKINYSVREYPVPEGYEWATSPYYTPNSETDWTVTNIHFLDETNISAAVVWEDNDDSDRVRPREAEIRLLADGKQVGKKTAEHGNNWYVNFPDLPASKAGEDIEYTLEEVRTDVLTGRDGPGTYAISEEFHAQTYTFTNTHSPEVYNIWVNKIWKDENDQDGLRPDEVNVTLIGKVGDTQVSSTPGVLTKDSRWRLRFPNMPKKTDEGAEISYSLTESDITGYTKDIKGGPEGGFTVTNTHEPEKYNTDGRITGTITWVDDNDRDGIRPSIVTIQLLADGVEEKTISISGNNNSRFDFADLPKYKDGHEIVYTVDVRRTSVLTGTDGERTYGIEITENPTGTFSITNTHTPARMTVEGTKTWLNEPDPSPRPASITIRLMANGAQIDRKDVSADAEGKWEWKFVNLYKYENGREIKYSILEDEVNNYNTAVRDFDVTNIYEQTTDDNTTQVYATRVWNDNNDQDGIRPDSVTIVLCENGSQTEKTATLNSHSDTVVFNDLDKNDGDGNPITYTVVEKHEGPITGTDGPGTYEDRVDQVAGATNRFTITNTHTPETVSINGSKTWVDNNNAAGKRPDSIRIHLRADGEVAESRDVSSPDWSWSFADKPKYRNGKQIKYTVTEDAVLNYTASTSGYNITNTYTPGKRQVRVSKVWVDAGNADGIRPEFTTVRLLANGTDTGNTIRLSSAGGWTGTFDDLDIQSGGTDIEYTVEEVRTGVITGTDSTGTYGIDYSGDSVTGYTVVNTHTPELININVTKLWEGDEDYWRESRPQEVTVYLRAGGAVVGSARIKASEGWKYTFTGLPRKENGRNISYSVSESAVSNYSSLITGTTLTGFIIRNHYNGPGSHTTEVTVTKVWDDDEDRDRKRPRSVTVDLLAKYSSGPDYRKVDEARLDSWSTHPWAHIFSVPEADEWGNPISYDVEEENVSGYSVTKTGDQTEGFTLINSHAPDTVSVAGSKVWVDDNDSGLTRPGSITVRLLADGEEIASKEVTAADDWKWNFTNLPKNANGKEIVYTVKEDVVRDYSYEITGRYDIKNTLTRGRTVVAAGIKWNDDNNRDGCRPANVNVRLVVNGEPTQNIRTLNSANNWSAMFTNLDASRTYTVEEVKTDVLTGVDGPGTYSFETIGDAVTGFTIVNDHTPELINTSVTVTWNDHNDSDGLRPNSTMIRLVSNGRQITAKEIKASDNWRWDIGFLYKYENGREKDYSGYTVTEDKTDVITGVDSATTYAFETSGNIEDGYTVKNIHTPEMTTVTGTKTWDDDNNSAGDRPSSIVIHLMRHNNDGTKEEVAAQTVTAADGWTWTFTDVMKYDHGALINYSVLEDNVYQYTTTLNGCDVTNKYEPFGPGVVTHKITYDLNGGNYMGRTGDIVEIYREGSHMGLHVAPINNGYRFVGWSDPNGVILQPGDVHTVMADRKFTAQWEAVPTPPPYLQRFITYDANGGTFTDADNSNASGVVVEIHTEGERISIRKAPIRLGYTFLYWKGSEYQPGDTYLVLDNHTFVAQWRKNSDPPGPDDPDDPGEPSTPTVTPSPDVPTVINPFADYTYTPQTQNSGLRSNGPDTGDDSRIWTWLLLFIISAGVLALAIKTCQRDGSSDTF
jgi:hypothetical protein